MLEYETLKVIKFDNLKIILAKYPKYFKESTYSLDNV
jgi:hypothetical protein